MFIYWFASFSICLWHLHVLWGVHRTNIHKHKFSWDPHNHAVAAGEVPEGPEAFHLRAVVFVQKTQMLHDLWYVYDMMICICCVNLHIQICVRNTYLLCVLYTYIYMSYIIHTQVKSSLEQENLPGLPIHIQLPGKISTGCHMEALQVCWQFTVCSLNHICLHMFFWWNLHFLPKSLSCFDRQNLHFCCWKKLAEWLPSFTWKMWPWNSTWPLQWG